MKTKINLIFLLMILGGAGSVLADTDFNYQGNLIEAGSPADGEYDFSFSLWDLESSGNQVGSSIFLENVVVSEGVFSVQLNFGDFPFQGDPRWLSIGVRAGNSVDPHTVLSPRKKVSTVPYSINSDFVVDNAIGSNEIANRSIQAIDISLESITSAEIDNGSIQNTDLADNVIDSAKVVNNSIRSEDILDNTVNGGDITDGSIQSIDIANGQIVGLDIANNTITGSKLSTNLNLSGTLTWGCRANSYRVGNWCIDALIQTPDTVPNSIAACHNRGLSLCNIEAIMTCDQVNAGSSNINTCGAVTDCDPGSSTGFVRTSTIAGSSTGSSFSNLLTYTGCAVGNNAANSTTVFSSGTDVGYFCCSPVVPQ